jgi:putative endonuclease
MFAKSISVYNLGIMKRGKSEIGRMGEDIACWYLKDKGYRIVDRNVKHPWGEIDVVAKDKKGVLVFVEVKALQGDGETYTPEQNYSFAKAQKTKRAAQLFAGSSKSQKLITDSGWRIDLVAIRITDPMLTDYKKDCVINHYENV